MSRLSIVCLISLLSLAAAWMPTKARREITMSSSVSNGRSKSIPFLLQPANLDGSLAGIIEYLFLSRHLIHSHNDYE